MWKDSMDTLLYKVAYKKEGFFGKLFSEGGQAIAKEGVQVGAKELIQVGAKELGQAITKEGTQGLLKEGTQASTKKLGLKLFSEGSQSTAKEGSQLLTKEFSQQTTKQTLQSGATSTVKKIAAGGLAFGTLFALDGIQTTDTNGDGVVDEKDKSLLDKGVDTAAGAAGEVLGKVAGGVAGVVGGVVGGVGSVGGSILEGLGIDLEVVKGYAWKVFYFILVIIAFQFLSFLYPLRKIIGLGENNKKFNLYHSIIQKV